MKEKKQRLSLVLSLVMLLGLFSGLSMATTARAEDGEVHPMRYVQPGNLPTEYEEGIGAVNEKLKEDGVDIEVEIIRIPWDVYDSKLNIMLTTGEAFELLHVMQDVKNLSTIKNLGGIVPVDDLVKDYPELVDKFSDTDWRGTVLEGQHYAIPDYWRSFDIIMSYINARTDIMKKVGYDEFPSDDVDALIDLMEKSQAAILEESGLKAYSWMHQIQDTAHWLHRTYDTYPFYVENSLGIVLARQDGTIDSFYESEEFKQDCEVYRKMNEKGLIHPEVMSLDHSIKYDQAELGAFLPSQTFDPNMEVAIHRQTDLQDAEVDWYEMAPEKPEMIYTFMQNMNAISATAEDPESGVKFLNWLYENQENHDLFHYGIVGKHYEPIGDRRMREILDENGVGLYNSPTWMSGYAPYIRYSEETPDKVIDYFSYKAENTVISPIAGFIFDASNVASELTNLQTEIMTSIYPIKLGFQDYDENIDQAIENLKAAGLDRYLEEYRAQFAEYLKENPDIIQE